MVHARSVQGWQYSATCPIPSSIGPRIGPWASPVAAVRFDASSPLRDSPRGPGDRFAHGERKARHPSLAGEAARGDDLAMRCQLNGRDLRAVICKTDGLSEIQALSAIEEVSGFRFDEGALYRLESDAEGSDVSLTRGGSVRLWIVTDEELADLERSYRRGAGDLIWGQPVDLGRFKGRAAQAIPIPPRRHSAS